MQDQVPLSQSASITSSLKFWCPSRQPLSKLVDLIGSPREIKRSNLEILFLGISETSGSILLEKSVSDEGFLIERNSFEAIERKIFLTVSTQFSGIHDWSGWP